MTSMRGQRDEPRQAVDAGTSREIYDPETGRFTRGPVTNQRRVAATAISLPQGVLVLGLTPGGGGVGGQDASVTVTVDIVCQDLHLHRPSGIEVVIDAND